MQTEPPSVPLARFFPGGVYPPGEIQEYKDECAALWFPWQNALAATIARRGLSGARGGRRNRWRTTSAECRERERIEADMYNDVRKAAEVHRTVRKYMKKFAQPGVRMIDMCETLEQSVRDLIEEKGLQARALGIATVVCPGPRHGAALFRVTRLPLLWQPRALRPA